MNQRGYTPNTVANQKPAMDRHELPIVEEHEVEEYDEDDCHSSDSEGSDVEIGHDESKAVNRVRVILMLLLLAVAASISISVYVYSRGQEKSHFEKQFSVHAEKVIDEMKSTTARSLRAIEGFALQITIHAIDHFQTWPNVALSSFESRARITIDLSDAISLIFLPIVNNSTRKEWEKFSRKHQQWLAESLAIQNAVTDNDDQESIDQLVETYGNDEGLNVPTEIFKHKTLLDNSTEISTEDGPGPYAPWWQFAPAFPVSKLMNFNMLSSPTRHSEIMALIETADKTIVGKAFDFVNMQDVGTSRRSAILNLFLNRRTVGANDYTGGPVSDLYSPIFNHFGSDKEIVGILTSYVYWQNYLEDVLPANVHGLVAVLENSCGQSFTFVLNGANATYLGRGDLHDTKYDDLEISTGFGGIFLQDVNDERQGQCLVNIRVFPSDEMAGLYMTPTPILFVAILVSTFFFTSVVFVWYQCLIDKRQQVVMKAAVQSTEVVRSLFPANVHARLFQEAEKQQNNVAASSSIGTYFSRFFDETENQSRALAKKGKVGTYIHSSVVKYNNELKKRSSTQSLTSVGSTSTKVSSVLTSESIFGSDPIADLFPNTTIMFADMVGFTAWASIREPTQVFTLLETIYHSFDVIAKTMRVFKVETVGDCYVAVAGLPAPCKDHAVVMARFATKCRSKMKELSRALETSLGPDTADLGLRIGLHSGPVTAGVLRGDKGRFQLFGDTMNTASRMESTGIGGKIHLSRETADILNEAGKSEWVVARKEKVIAKGKGELQTYWLQIGEGESTIIISSMSSIDESNASFEGPFEDELQPQQSFLLRGNSNSEHNDAMKHFNSMKANAGLDNSGHQQEEISGKSLRLIQYDVDVLTPLLRQIVARRLTRKGRHHEGHPWLLQWDNTRNKNKNGDVGSHETVLDEFKDIISLPKFDASIIKNQKHPDSVHLPTSVVEQLTDLVTNIFKLYRNNPFHNFEHASHVSMSVVKLLSRIVNPAEVLSATADSSGTNNNKTTTKTTTNADQKIASDLHDHTFGITSDPLTQFACIFSALIHDLDHPGVSNKTLIEEQQPLAIKYKNKSVAEQNSVDMAWDLLMQAKYKDLRQCICADEDELKRFRQLVVNVVMATDIMDKDLNNLRKARWEKAFSEESASSDSGGATTPKNGSTKTFQSEDINRKATIVIEHLIQASDVAHTMQHWNIYKKWNERLFHETYHSYLEGRIKADPSVGWYDGELGFFDFYIFPLAKKLDTCGVFGVSSDEYLNYALANRREWEEKGKRIVEEYLLCYD